MNVDVFQAALAATARVACCAVLISCQKTPIQPEEPAPMMEHATQKEEQPAAQPPIEELSPKSRDLRPKGSTEFLACTPKIEAHLTAEQSTPDLKMTKEVAACCDMQGNEVDATTRLKWEHRDECCDILNWTGPAACTPWGPPTPPHMVV